ncbi:hypothetical protein MKW94_024992 [Papaver nudicaule]|uniref:Uncharacterized protein n=1 Tax=Papaver nudicaule TaxID=74823 RepID=A0AA41UYA0_PAPNU|nr:hypothetical protein [Papaver nudicaule]
MAEIPTSKSIQEGAAKIDDDDERPCKISRTSSFIANLPGDCLNLIFKCLETKVDRNSFGLTCHDWLRIQSNNHDTLWYYNKYNEYDPGFYKGKYPKTSPENLAKITVRLLFRFQHLKRLSLRGLPVITDFVHPKSPPFGSKVERLFLDRCSVYSDMQLSFIFSWFPRLTFITLDSTNITDKGLEALAKCCSSLETVHLPRCCSITDSGLGSLIRNCRELRILDIDYCNSITGTGFMGCARTLTHLYASVCKLTPEGINAVVSGGGLRYLYLRMISRGDDVVEVEEECTINTEAVITISIGCPLLKELSLPNCEEVELEGWEAIGQNCKELEHLHVMGCQKLCDKGLLAISDGCNKLSELYVDKDKHSCSVFALELFELRNPRVMYLWP